MTNNALEQIYNISKLDPKIETIRHFTNLLGTKCIEFAYKDQNRKLYYNGSLNGLEVKIIKDKIIFLETKKHNDDDK